MKDAMATRYRALLTILHDSNLQVCSGEVNSTNKQLLHPPTITFQCVPTHSIHTQTPYRIAQKFCGSLISRIFNRSRNYLNENF